MEKIFTKTFLLVVLILISTNLLSAQKKPVTFADIMKFKQIKNPTISTEGNWITYEANPDRGNGSAIIKSVNEEVEYSFERGSKPSISNDEKWSSLVLLPDFIEREEAKKETKLKNDLLYMNLNSGKVDTLFKVKKYSFTKNSFWLAALHYAEEDTSKEKKKSQ